MAIAYVVVAWLTIQVVDVLVQLMNLPEWIGRAIILLLVVSFPIALVLAWALELTPQGIRREREVDRSESITQITGRKLDFSIIGVLTVAVIFFAVDKFLLDSEPNPIDEDLLSSAVSLTDIWTTETQTVAVIPFVDMSPGVDQGWIGETIATEMQTELSRRSDFQVLSRSSSFAIPEGARSSQEIGRKLGVDVLVEGTIRRIGDRIRVTVQLVSVDDGYQLWSDVYESQLTDDFSAEIAVAEFFSIQVRDQLAAPFTPKIQLVEFSETSESSLANALGASELSSSSLGVYFEPDDEEAADEDNKEDAESTEDRLDDAEDLNGSASDEI